MFLEIDGLAYDVLRRALRDGNAPVLARWIHDDGYRLEPLGDRLVLADRRLPGRAAARLQRRHAGVPLVGEGHRAARSSPTTRATRRRSSAAAPTAAACSTPTAPAARTSSPATRRTRMLTMSTVLDRKRQGRLGQDYFAYFASPYGVARTLLRVDRRDLHRALLGGPAGPPRRAPADQARLEVRARALLRDRDPARPAGRGGHRRRARRPAGRSTRRSWPTTRSRTTRASSGRTRWRCCARSTRRSTGSPPRSSTRRGRTGWSCSPTTARARARRSSSATAKGSRTSSAASPATARSAPRTRTATRGSRPSTRRSPRSPRATRRSATRCARRRASGSRRRPTRRSRRSR